ncbi:ABC transporter permease subunit [Haloferula chungangensis]|uniref:ABC transporter permease subunit n=1 Tax=Haloferula chungangensis TaxID=1048331 RepID=A0ABW2L3I4_9BACT
MKLLQSIKYPILKAIDFSGLTFLSPVVRLCYGEEPAVQAKKIVQWIIIPVAAIGIFLMAWNSASEKIHTKSGRLPSPKEMFQAYGAIDTFAEYEALKEEAYLMSGPERLSELTATESLLATIEPLAKATTEKVAATKEAYKEKQEKTIAPLTAQREKLKTEFEAAQDERKASLASQSESLQPGDQAGYEAFLAAVKLDTEMTDLEKEQLRNLKTEIDNIRDKKSKEVAAALYAQTQAAEEKQFLEKKIDQLTRDNRSEKVASAKADIKEDTDALMLLTGADALKSAKRIAKDEARLAKTETSDYAGAKTLWYQTRRSILCVFTGFILGSAIAIPIGILCGLNSTFMAAMTPFVAIFKPVSPIVWLPICLIIASAYVPAPEDSALMAWMWEDAWFLKSYDINPAFIASACTVALCSLWATLANTALGVASIDKDHMNVARVLKLGFWSRLFKIVIPSALPLIFAGLRISLGVGWMVLIAAELLSSSEGIGKFVWDQFNNGASDSFAKMVVVVFIVGFIGLILDRIMIVFQRLVSFEGGAAGV